MYNHFFWFPLQGSYLLQQTGPASIPVFLHVVREDAHSCGGDQHLWTRVGPAVLSLTAFSCGSKKRSTGPSHQMAPENRSRGWVWYEGNSTFKRPIIFHVTFWTRKYRRNKDVSLSLTFIFKAYWSEVTDPATLPQCRCMCACTWWNPPSRYLLLSDEDIEAFGFQPWTQSWHRIRRYFLQFLQC